MGRNEEFRKIVIKLIILQTIFSLIIFFAIKVEMGKVNKKIVEQDVALVGSILNDNPELEKDIVKYIIKDVTEEEIHKGKETLRQYGYHIDMDKNLQPLLKHGFFKTEIFASFLILIFIIPIFLLIRNEYSKIYDKVGEVSYAAERVVEGDFSIVLKEEGEGDFNILNHQFNQMANRLKNSFEILQKERVFLKNTISDISHQLKTPLSSLIMLNELILEDEDMEVEVKNDFLKKSKSQLDRMEWLIINLLKVARIEAGAIEFKKDEVKLMEPVDIALSTLAMKIKEKDQTVEVAGDLNGSFYGDKDWIGEALINIIKNAIEHNKYGGDIEIRLKETPLFSSIIIKDNGEGINKKEIPYIFERFYKGSSEVKTDSIGIGLNLSKLIVESQDGTISVKSEKGEGTEFTITFLSKY